MAHYDTYNYPLYWEGREYEHASEEAAIKTLLSSVPKINTACEIGAGFGRLIPTYLFRANRVIVTDPSSKLLRIARYKYSKNKKVKFIQATIENVPRKIRRHSVDLVILIRVLHHIEDLGTAIESVCHIIKPNGYFILEFANKRHLKATILEFFKGNLTFPIEIFPKDLRSKKHLKKKTLPFLNYHPDDVKRALDSCHFQIIDKLSVSNIRSAFAKKHLSTNTLVSIEKHVQRPLSGINFGPSIFILAKKTS